MAGIEAEVIGTGNTECGSTVRQARIANMTIKENSECADGLVEEFKTHRINRIKIKKALPNGFNDQMLCAAGILVNTKTTQDGIKEIYTVSAILQLSGTSHDPNNFSPGCMPGRQWRSTVCVPSKTRQSETNARRQARDPLSCYWM